MTSASSPEAATAATSPFLMNGEQYKESLRDGRRVVTQGRFVSDITADPDFARGADTAAELYDAQLDPMTQDVLTFVDPESGERMATTWLIPRSHEDLERRREALKFSTYHTFGTFGRPPDWAAVVLLGYMSILDRFAAVDPERAQHVGAFVSRAARENAMCADVLAEPQSDRTVPNRQKPGRLRVVEERKDGLVIYGGKAVCSSAAISHYSTIANLLFTDMDPACNVFCQVPLNAENLTLVAREPLAVAASSSDHPVDAIGDEPDTFFVFDHVFVPWEDVFVYQSEELLGLYYEIGHLGHWHVLARLWYRAELFAGVAQAIVDALGTAGIPGVRAALAEVFSYASALKAFVIAAEATAKVSSGGFLLPNQEIVTPGRLYSIDHYPRIMQIIRDISGQGMISRFPESTWQLEEVAGKLEEFMTGHNVSAQAKNRIFNMAWDLTCSGNAMRVALFENVNAAPPAWIREEIFQSYDRSSFVDYVLKRAGVEEAPPEEGGPNGKKQTSFDRVRKEAERAKKG